MKFDLEQTVEQTLAMELGGGVDLYCERTRSIEIAGESFSPDGSKAFLEFRLVHSLPMVTQYQSTWHPATVANSFPMLRGQVFNYRHQMVKYSRPKNKPAPQTDHIFGAVMAVEYPRTPSGGWRINERGEWNAAEKNPGIRVLCNLPKKAVGADRILGSFQTGRQEWTGSIECSATILNSAILLERPRGQEEDDLPSLGPDMAALLKKHTPDDLAKAGYWHVPFTEAPEDLLQCFDWDAKVFIKPHKARRCIDLLGGIGGTVDLTGVGLVNYGGEPTAQLVEIMAEGEAEVPSEMVKRVEAGLVRLGELCEKMVRV